MKAYCVAEDCHPAELLIAYQAYWKRDPLWLYGLTASDPRKHPERATLEAIRLIKTYLMTKEREHNDRINHKRARPNTTRRPAPAGNSATGESAPDRARKTA